MEMVMTVLDTKGWKGVYDWHVWKHDNTKGTVRKKSLPNRFDQTEKAFQIGALALEVVILHAPRPVADAIALGQPIPTWGNCTFICTRRKRATSVMGN